jgi:two-component system, LytTR family, response regulator
MKRKAIIVDDEKMARALLDGMLKEFCPELEIVEHCADLPSAVKAIVKHQPELVFLDIEMPGHNGLELLDFFDESKVNFSIIFTTAYNQYAIQAFKLSAIDYLLKPIDSNELVNAVSRFKKEKQNREALNVLRENYRSDIADKKIAIATINSVYFLELKEICYFQAEGSYTTIVLDNGQKSTASKGLKYYEDLLVNYKNFMRCQKSFIVNLDKITEFIKSDGGYLVLNKTHKIPISNDKHQELMANITSKVIVL